MPTTETIELEEVQEMLGRACYAALEFTICIANILEVNYYN